MKFQVYAGSLGVACEAYIAAQTEKREAFIDDWITEAMMPRYSGWWLWRKDITRTKSEAESWVRDFYRSSFLEKEQRLRAIAKHKASNILLEVTDEEIGDIALYLPDEGKAERI